MYLRFLAWPALLFFFLEFAAGQSADEKQQVVALIQAATHGQTETVKSLLQNGADVNAKHPLTKWTPLIAAALYGHVDTVDFLIKAGADVNAVDSKHATPLMKAVMQIPSDDEAALISQKAKIIKLLIRAGADPQIKDNFDSTPWEAAVYAGDTILVQAFEEAAVEGVKETRLMLAIADNDVPAVKKFVDDGANVNFRDESGANALSEAVLSGNTEILRMVIRAGADLNARFDKGWTALMLTVQYNQPDMVHLLLESGADATLKNDSGLTALQIAEAFGNTAILKLLRANREAQPRRN